jgi:hypothetical protein
VPTTSRISHGTTPPRVRFWYASRTATTIPFGPGDVRLRNGEVLDCACEYASQSPVRYARYATNSPRPITGPAAAISAGTRRGEFSAITSSGSANTKPCRRVRPQPIPSASASHGRLASRASAAPHANATTYGSV